MWVELFRLLISDANRLPCTFTKSAPRKDHCGVDLISDALPFGRLWYGEPNAVANAIGYAMHRSRSCRAVIRVYDDAWQRDRNARANVDFDGCVAFFDNFHSV
jgi:hypothetical protein